MWAYESVFYQIYPLGFCGAPFVYKRQTGFRTSKNLAPMPSIFPRSLSLTHTVTIPGIIQRSIPDSVRMKTLPQSVTIFIKKVSKLYQTVYSTMLAAVSGHFRMFWRKNGIPRTKTGSTSVLTATQTITTVCGMRAGKVTTIWSN